MFLTFLKFYFKVFLNLGRGRQSFEEKATFRSFCFRRGRIEFIEDELVF